MGHKPKNTPKVLSLVKTKVRTIFMGILIIIMGIIPTAYAENTNSVFAGFASESQTMAPAVLEATILESTMPASVEDLYTATRNHKTVTLNERFAITKAPQEDGFTETDNGFQIGDQIELNLFEDISYTVTIDKISEIGSNSVSIRGRVDGYPMGYFLLSTTGGISLGSLVIPENDEIFKIEPIPGQDNYLLMDLDSEQLDTGEDNDSENQLFSDIDSTINNSLSSIAAPTANPADPAEIGIMVVYTPEEETAEGGVVNMRNKIVEAIASAQLILDNSNTGVTLNLVHTYRLNYVEGSGGGNLFSDAQDAMEDSETINKLRSIYGADLIAMIVKGGNGGKAWGLRDDASPLDAPIADWSGKPDSCIHMVVSRSRIGAPSYSFSHELGHLLGAGHHWNITNTSSAGPQLFKYSSGSRWDTGDDTYFCSVMTYYAAGDFADGFASTRIPYFSNPNISVDGFTIGDATQEDNSRTIRESKHAIASYRYPLVEALDQPGLYWETGGNSQWFGQSTSYTDDGVSGAQSGSIGDNEESWIQTVVEGPGTLTFHMMVRSEHEGDYLDFTLDGALKKRMSGHFLTFREYTYELGEGEHTLKWRYYKNADTIDYDDAGWVDNITWTGNIPTYTINYNAGVGSYGGPQTFSTNRGISRAFSVAPADGYEIDSVTGCNGELVGNIYETGPITEDCTINSTYTPNTYKVSTTSGIGGSISPSSRYVSHGNYTTFDILPNSGYLIDNVTGCGGSLSGNTYTTGTITSNCTVSASFEEEPVQCIEETSSLNTHTSAGRAYSETAAGWWWLPGTTTWYAIGTGENLGTDGNAVVTLYTYSGEEVYSTTPCTPDTIAPVISLLGDSNMDIVVGNSYVEPGYYAEDNKDGDVSGDVVVSGYVNSNAIGSYTLTYTVTDSAGNTATATRVVNVINAPACQQHTSTLSLHETNNRAYSETAAGWWWLPGTTTWYAVGSRENLGTDGTATVTLKEQPAGYFSVGTCP